ncbi:TolB family protein [Bacteroidota bacterium]
MKQMCKNSTIYSGLCVAFLFFSGCSLEENLGFFEGHNDIGKINIPGSVKYDPAKDSYEIAGSGENMWFNEDALQYVWKQVSGNVALTADIKFIGEGKNAHRKACLIIRQGFEPGSAYADAALHGDGLTSLQYRESLNATTHEIQANISGPARLRIEKEGEFVFMSIGMEGQGLKSAGGSTRIEFTDPFYIGLGVCSHDSTTIETAVFSNVILESGKQTPTGEPVLESTLETVPIASGDRRVVYHAIEHFEAPNWSRDGKTLIFNSKGLLYSIPAEGGTPKQIDTDFATRCNNDHGISTDGTQLVISDQSQGEGRSLIYTLPIQGGTPTLVTKNGPSYWHGWSPDDKTLAYCAERNGNYDIYTISVNGGKEMRLTTTDGLDDGPDYSPDGEYIYFNSVRTGTMQIWRMKTDGSEQEQVTFDEYQDWFPHPSPDGKWIVFISYQKEVEGHPANKDVMLRLMSVDDGEIRVLAKLFGGQGTINVPSWSPDSGSIAFVSYRLVYQ